ncbi:MAG: hypothetical protein RLY20_1576 [Verrucomicrobiota bacterium]|jgi:hypothetical protein
MIGMNREQQLRRRIRWLTWFFIVGLVISGVTAIPLVAEVEWLSNITGAQQLVATPMSTNAPEWAIWLERIRLSLRGTQSAHPQLFYGTDWLAFGHIVIAVVFIGALRDPVRNKWLFDFGLIACAMVIPWAFVFGAIREIPVWWRLIDCSFGVFGAVPLWWCRKWVKELEETGNDKASR